MARLMGRPPGAHRPRWWRGAVGLLGGLYFLVPIAASVLFTVDVPGQGFTLSSYTGILHAQGFTSSLLLSLELAAATIVVALGLLVPAMIAARLGSPKLRTLLEIVCSLPLVIPTVALAAGFSNVLSWGPQYLSRTPLFQTLVALQDQNFPVVLVLAYSVMSLPLAYRALDAGLRAVDIRTLMEAARSCGAGPIQAIVQVVLPNMRGALLNAGFLTLALVLGEYTFGAILGFQPFAVWIVAIGADQAELSVAVSVTSLLMTWALLLVFAAAGRPRTRTPRRRRAATVPGLVPQESAS